MSIVLCEVNEDPLIVFKTIEDAKNTIIKSFKGEDVRCETSVDPNNEHLSILVVRNNLIIKRYIVKTYIPN